MNEEKFIRVIERKEKDRSHMSEILTSTKLFIHTLLQICMRKRERYITHKSLISMKLFIHKSLKICRNKRKMDSKQENNRVRVKIMFKKIIIKMKRRWKI